MKTFTATVNVLPCSLQRAQVKSIKTRDGTPTLAGSRRATFAGNPITRRFHPRVHLDSEIALFQIEALGAPMQRHVIRRLLIVCAKLRHVQWLEVVRRHERFTRFDRFAESIGDIVRHGCVDHHRLLSALKSVKGSLTRKHPQSLRRARMMSG